LRVVVCVKCKLVGWVLFKVDYPLRASIIPSCVAVLSRHSPIIQSHCKTQSGSIESRDGRRKLAKHSNHLLRSRKSSEKSRFNEENAAITLQPKPVAEYTEEPPKGATLSTDGRGCVVRFLHKRATKHHRNVILTASGGRQWSEHQMLRTKGYHLMLLLMMASRVWCNHHTGAHLWIEELQTLEILIYENEPKSPGAGGRACSI
jgi:hypothetical protein